MQEIVIILGNRIGLAIHVVNAQNTMIMGLKEPKTHTTIQAEIQAAGKIFKEEMGTDSQVSLSQTPNSTDKIRDNL